MRFPKGVIRPPAREARALRATAAAVSAVSLAAGLALAAQACAQQPGSSADRTAEGKGRQGQEIPESQPRGPSRDTAAPGATPSSSPTPGGRGPAELKGLDNIIIGVNDPDGAAAAYERLGFTVIRTGGSGPGQPTAFIDLSNGYLEFVGPEKDSIGQMEPYTLEGGLAQGWRVEPMDLALAVLQKGGARFTAPVPGTMHAAPGEKADEKAPSDERVRRTVPEIQPISGTSVYLLDYEGSPLTWIEKLAKEKNVPDASVHVNGAAKLAYVTVAVRRIDHAIKILEQWGLDPQPPVIDERNAYSVEVPLRNGTLYVIQPRGQGGLADFLEERRAQAPPVGDRYYEGSILSVGIEVEDIHDTIDFFDQRGIRHIGMKLPSGTVEVVQGAPNWNLRLEFVEPGTKPPAEALRAAAQDTAAGGAAAGDVGASGSSGSPPESTR